MKILSSEHSHLKLSTYNHFKIDCFPALTKRVFSENVFFFFCNYHALNSSALTLCSMKGGKESVFTPPGMCNGHVSSSLDSVFPFILLHLGMEVSRGGQQKRTIAQGRWQWVGAWHSFNFYKIKILYFPTLSPSVVCPSSERQKNTDLQVYVRSTNHSPSVFADKVSCSLVRIYSSYHNAWSWTILGYSRQLT